MNDEPKDNRGPAVIVMGGVIDGFKFYGPFDSIDAAVAELEKLLFVPSCSVCLLQPVSELPMRHNG